jgi:cell wall assembly regulator SMI1
MTISETWARIKKWYGENVPPGLVVYNQGATTEELAKLEKAIGRGLPDDLREFYGLNNGASGCALLCYGSFLSLQQVSQLRSELLEQFAGIAGDFTLHPLDHGIKPVFWSDLRIPITDNLTGDHVLIDLDPGQGGSVGQIVFFDHETGPGVLLAPSFHDWLIVMARDSANNLYKFHPLEENVIKFEDYDYGVP